MRKMKDSGIKWIGKIPDTWNVIRLKNASWLKGRIGWQGLRAEEFTDEGPFLITGTDFKNGYVDWNTCVHISEERFNQDLTIQIKENDLLITKDGTIGKLAVAKNCPEKVSLNSGVFIIRNTGKYKYDDKFMYYLLQSREFTLWFDLSNAGNSTICHLNQEKFYNFKFAYPPLPEQKKIADYLDGKCSDIDQIRADIEKQIEILTDYKKSVITEAVTKGLDPKAKMKDSGIEWIGQIPEHWEVKPLWALTECYGRIGFRGYTAEDLVDEGEGAITLSPTNINEGKLTLEKCSYISWEKYYESPEIMVKENDVLLVKTASVGKCVIYTSSEPATVNPQFVVFKKCKCLNKFLYYNILSDFIQKQLKLSSMGSVIPTLSQKVILSYKIPTPPLFEQKSIADYLDEKCSEIEIAIAEKQKQFDTLEEYKKSLIFEYVTGKKEVV